MTALRDISLLIARVILGVVLIAHGWQKYNDWTVEGTGQNFDKMGVPSPELAAQFATYFEIAGGALLIIGLLVRLVGPILFVEMAAAAWFAHRDGGIFVADGGWELVAVIGAAGLALAGAGAGRISLDYLLAMPFRRRKESKLAKKNAEAHGYVDPASGTGNFAYAGAGNGAVVGTGAAAGAGNGAMGNNHVAHGKNTGSFGAATDRNFAQEDYSDAKTTAFERPQTGTADGHGIANNAAHKVDPNAPTTQWPGDTRKK